MIRKEKMTHKILLPWESQFDTYGFRNITYIRRFFGVKYENPCHCFVRVYSNFDSHDWMHTYSNDVQFDSAKKAKKNVDEYLLKQGFRLLTANEKERFESKLIVLI